jgi:hypothetical protein
MSTLQHHTNTKTSLGQFYTTNAEYILTDLSLPNKLKVVEPFVGQGDLINWVKKHYQDIDLITYDIDPKIECTEVRDTLLNPPSYKNCLVVTNPPFLARNKNNDKVIYDKFKVDDLYKAALSSFVDGDCEGGILIIPLNFFSGEEGSIREKFLNKYQIIKLNIFEERVFDDTAYTVCSFSFVKKSSNETQTIPVEIFPKKVNFEVTLEKKYEYRIGGDILTTPNKLKLGRLLVGQEPSTHLKLYAVDSGTPEGRIRLVYDENPYFGKNTDRVFCSITSPVEIKDQIQICEKFNQILEKYRLEYNSLFLTNYRESTKHYSRKRISFSQAFSLLNQIILNE